MSPKKLQKELPPIDYGKWRKEQPLKATGQPLPNPDGLPNPQAILPNPYAASTAASSAPVQFTEEQTKAEQQKKAPGIIYLTSSILCL